MLYLDVSLTTRRLIVRPPKPAHTYMYILSDRYLKITGNLSKSQILLYLIFFGPNRFFFRYAMYHEQSDRIADYDPKNSLRFSLPGFMQISTFCYYKNVL